MPRCWSPQLFITASTSQEGERKLSPSPPIPLDTSVCLSIQLPAPRRGFWGSLGCQCFKAQIGAARGWRLITPLGSAETLQAGHRSPVPPRDDATEARPAVTRCSSKANTAPSLVARCDSLGSSTLPARWQGHPMPMPGTGGSAGTPSFPPQGLLSSRAGTERCPGGRGSRRDVVSPTQGAEGISGTGAGRRRAAATRQGAAGARPGPSPGSGP